MKVTFSTCINELVIIEENRKRLWGWEQRPRLQRTPLGKTLQTDFMDQVKGFVHETLFDLGAPDIAEAQRHTIHPLGSLQKHIHSLRDVENFYTPFSFSFFFHHWLETHARIPLWQEIWPAMHRAPYRAWFYEPLLAELGEKYSEQQLEKAFQWRFGKYYYSALRELSVFAGFRSFHQITLKYHLFADIVLRVDGWRGNKLLYLRVPNQYEARKPVPATGKIFRVIPVAAPQPQRGAFGRLWLPPDMDIAASAFQDAPPIVPPTSRAAIG